MADHPTAPKSLINWICAIFKDILEILDVLNIVHQIDVGIVAD